MPTATRPALCARRRRLFLLESAIDELAVALNMDPVELRRRKDADHEPIKNLPYTSRSQMACFGAAAKSFGWDGQFPHVRALDPGAVFEVPGPLFG
jgi:xanthine dehydrogenase YagR molybdenum-binding subunit